MIRRRSNLLRAVLPFGGSSSRVARSVLEAETAAAVDLLDAPPAGALELAELHEFMTCERDTRRADPEFRERLRSVLWWGLVVRRSGGAVPRA